VRDEGGFDVSGNHGGSTIDLSGKTLGGRWRIGSLVGSGALGSTWKATDTQTGKPAAVRVPATRLASGGGLVTRWPEAVQALAKLGHPNLVPVLDAGVEEGTPWAALGWLEGGNLEDRLAARPSRPGVAEVAPWLGKIAAALDFVHASGVVHRGVRSSAILFDGAGEPFLGELCTVKALGEGAADAVLAAASSRGTDYFGPEADAEKTLTPAFDQYGLAVVAYEALSGTTPHHGQTGAAAVVVRQAKPAQSLRDVAPGVSPEVAAVVARALEGDPAARYPSCSAFAKAFAAAAASAPATSAPETKFVRRPGVGGAPAPAASPVPAAAGGAAAAAAAAPADPHATRMLPKGGAKKASRPNLPEGGAPRRKGGKTVLVALLAGLGLAAVALVLLRDDTPKEVPVTLKITFPQDGAMVMTPDVLIRGEYTSPRKTDVVKVEGVEVMSAEGRFERNVTLSQEGLQKIEVTVEEKGKVRKRVEWRVTYRAMWRPLLDEATRLANAGDWVAAKEKLAVAKSKGASEKDLPPDVVSGIERYEAAPVLTVDSPADGATLDKPSVTLRGSFSSGRKSDQVKVDGAVVPVADGKFEAVLPLPEGPRDVAVTVEDGGAVRKKVSLRVVYVRPPEAWEAWLSTWATADGAAREETSGYPKRVVRRKDGVAMVLVPAGAFWMGANKDAKTKLPNEEPGHEVTISKAYYMDEAPITVAQWKTYVETGEATLPNLGVKGTKDDMPIYNVTHAEATTYTRWAGVSLPTEAQWERAAKGGKDDRVYPWGAEDDVKRRNAVGDADEFERLAPVKSFPANDYGLFDMAGNVWQWTDDWYDAGYYVSAERTDPKGPAAGTEKCVRGGAWDKTGLVARVGYRSSLDPKQRASNVGFRCVRSLP